ncbi:TOMM system kinase/cyclase fusion protein [Nannocystis bainbridge]|uniref:TOMM system kinase/cyclase fusion protein n=1 Tax=Nannocystis bainbridge TaxID=2995303 RepID=A0ABT5DQ30_9BACT|nr:TOMM system kinase/cyclase fusion protein [Nannocystis bainbridge]MDC0715766.1 TOMM system kinase/cyclase fusion protein [Nannocystis bainbridge]
MKDTLAPSGLEGTLLGQTVTRWSDRAALLSDAEETTVLHGAGERPGFMPLAKKGDRIGGEDGQRFELLERLGAGGMGVVYLARDTLLDRAVAIKFILQAPTDDSSREIVDRFRTEARASARLSHENIVRVFDLGSAVGVPFLVMEYLEGRPLDAVLAEGPLEARRVVQLVIDIVRGLSHAHRADIVHRDLKPANVFVTRDGRAKIVDFGLASVAAGRADTQTSPLSGTPRYMSPEQWRGEDQDGRTDLWSVGVMLFEMLCGHSPFWRDHLSEVRANVLSEAAAPALRAFRPELPALAETVAARALAKDVARRFGTAEELLDALVGLELALARPGRAGEEPVERPRRASERRQVTLLSCSLVEALALAEVMDPDAYADLLDGFLDICATVARQLEGTMVAAHGGHALVCFGWPAAHEDDAERALRAGFLVVDSVRGLASAGGATLAARIGICSGSVVADKREHEAAPRLLGELPHVATWLEGQAAPHEILLSGRARALVRGTIEVEARGERRPPGGGRTIEVLRALRPSRTVSRFDRAGGELTPLVGREAEVDALRGLWAQVREGRGQFVLLSGEAGLGKSRLVQTLRAYTAGEAHQRLVCQCWPHFRNSALHPLLEATMRAMDIEPEATASDRLARVEAALADLRVPLAEHVPLFAAVLAIPLDGRYAAPQLSPDLLKNRVQEALIRTVLALAAQRPTLLVVEDLHWSDQSTLELLELLVARMTEAPLMVVATSRPEFAPNWPARPHLHRLALRRLSPHQTAAMVALAARGQALPEELVAQLVARADGIPLFVEEVTQTAAEVWQREGQASAVRRASSALAAIPATLQELLLARLDRLQEAGREVAQLGAVLGRDFPYALLRHASDRDEETLRTGLMQLVEAGIVRVEGSEQAARYVFRHALVQEAALSSLLRPRRQYLHGQATRAILGQFPELAELQPELLAHHFVEAGDHERAIEWLEKAGQKAVQRSANTDAVSHYAQAIALLRARPEGDPRDRKELALQLALGAPLMATRGYAAPEVHDTYARARELCRRAGDDAQLFPSVLGLWQFYMVGGAAEISANLGRQLVAQAETTDNRTMLMLAYRALGTSQMLLGEIAGCRELTEKGLALYDIREHGKLALRYGQDPGVTNGLYLAWVLWFLGHPDQAVARAREALRLAQEIEHPLSIAFAMNYLATLHNYRGEFATARDLADRAEKVATEHKLQLWLAMCQIQRGWSQLGSGEREAGASELAEGVAGWTRTGAKAGISFFQAAAIWGLWRAGRHDEAMRKVDEVEEFMRRSGERFFEAEVLRLRGELLLSTGMTSGTRTAEDCFRRGLEVARRQQARAWELRLALSQARLLVLRGSPGEARELVAGAYEWFKEGLETADLREARALLGQLG